MTWGHSTINTHAEQVAASVNLVHLLCITISEMEMPKGVHMSVALLPQISQDPLFSTFIKSSFSRTFHRQMVNNKMV